MNKIDAVNVIDKKFGFYSYDNPRTGRIKQFFVHRVVLEIRPEIHSDIIEIEEVASRTGWKFQIGIEDIIEPSNTNMLYLFFIPKYDEPHKSLIDMFSNSKNVINNLGDV